MPVRVPPKKATIKTEEPENVKNEIEKLYYKFGFAQKKKPVVADPNMPVKLSDFPLESLQDRQAEYAAWREYAEDLLRTATAEVMRLTEEHDRIYAEKMVAAPDGKVTDKKFVVRADTNVKVKQLELTNAEMLQSMLISKVESFTNCLSVLSREITLRQNKA